MDQTIIYGIIGLVALLLGIVAGKIYFSLKTHKNKIDEAQLQAQKIISEAEKIKKPKQPKKRKNIRSKRKKLYS